VKSISGISATGGAYRRCISSGDISSIKHGGIGGRRMKAWRIAYRSSAVVARQHQRLVWRIAWKTYKRVISPPSLPRGN